LVQRGAIVAPEEGEMNNEYFDVVCYLLLIRCLFSLPKAFVEDVIRVGQYFIFFYSFFEREKTAKDEEQGFVETGDS
jgi:hypothetical protein